MPLPPVALPLLQAAAPAGESIAERARRGDVAAFRAIFEHHGESVRRFLHDLTGDAAAAEEATQETFVRAHRALASVRDEGRLCSWLLGIARNVFYESLRARQRQAAQPPSEEVPDPTATPERALLGKEADVVLADALSRLTSERRAAMVLRLDHGLPYEEIAQVMGWSLQKVKNEIHRARLDLRRQLGPYLELGGEP